MRTVANPRRISPLRARPFWVLCAAVLVSGLTGALAAPDRGVGGIGIAPTSPGTATRTVAPRPTVRTATPRTTARRAFEGRSILFTKARHRVGRRLNGRPDLSTGITRRIWSGSRDRFSHLHGAVALARARQSERSHRSARTRMRALRLGASSGWSSTTPPPHRLAI